MNKDLTGEHLLLGAIIVLSAYMFVEARTFGGDTKIFPLFAAAITFVGATLVLFRNYLPEPLKVFVTESGLELGSDLPSQAEKEAMNTERESTAEDGPQIGDGRWLTEYLDNTTFTVLLTAMYIALGVLFGFLWITPVFAGVYALQFRLPWYLLAIIALVSFAIVYVFVVFFYAPFDEGILLVVHL